MLSNAKAEKRPAHTRAAELQHVSHSEYEHKLELAFFDLLTSHSIKFTAHPKVPGKPDCLIKPNVLVFVDSDFWHGWHFSQWRDRLPKDYWVEKIERNIRRDVQKFRTLRSEGYKVIRIWEHTLKSNPDRAIELISKALNS